MEEEGFGLAVLEAEDLAVTANVELALFYTVSANCSQPSMSCLLLLQFVSCPSDSAREYRILGRESRRSYLSGVDLLTREGIVVGTHLECCVYFRR